MTTEFQTQAAHISKIHTSNHETNNRRPDMKSAFHLIRTLLVLSCLVSLAFSLEDNDIDTQEPHVNRFKTRRHHNRFRNQQHKRLQHSRGLRARAPTSSAMNYDEGDYDMRNNYPIPITNLTAKVGDTVILNCAINSSYGSNPGVSLTELGILSVFFILYYVQNRLYGCKASLATCLL